MQLEAVTAEIRPRSEWESADLGLALARRDFWRCWLVWWMGVLPFLVPVVVLSRNSPFWATVALWWVQLIGARMVLFELSRRLFGEKPSLRQTMSEVPRAWSRRFGYRLLLARFSPWAPLTMAIEDLEGLRGKNYQIRSQLLLRRSSGSLIKLRLLVLFLTMWMTVGVFLLAGMLLPENFGLSFDHGMRAMAEGHFDQITEDVIWLMWGCYALTASLTGVFLTGAGFGVYVNGRIWVEGWDVELAFKRMATRLAKLALVLLTFGVGLTVSTAGAEEARPPKQVITEVKASPDFEIRKLQIEENTLAPGSSSSLSSSGAGDGFSVIVQVFLKVVLWMVVILLVAGLGYLIWRYRHLWVSRSANDAKRVRKSTVRTVLGMEITPDSLPDQLPDTVWKWWGEGRHREAMALLYRGAISRVIERARAEIQESDTEGDCVGRVKTAGEMAFPGYFERVTGLWVRLAYAGLLPVNEEVHELCRSWPYEERRAS